MLLNGPGCLSAVAMKRDLSVPRHVAIVMDGNGRWAKKRYLPRFFGHKAGVDALVKVINASADRGVEYLTVFAFSSENWKRPEDEVSGLMGLVLVAVTKYLAKLARDGVKIVIVGDRNAVSDRLRAAWIEAEVAGCLAVGEGLSARLHGAFTRPPKPLNAAQNQLFAGVRGCAALIGVDLAWKPSGGVCEGNNLFAAGLPNLDTLGVRGGDIHSEAEHAWPDSFVERAQLSALILLKLGSGEIDGPGIRAAMGR